MAKYFILITFLFFLIQEDILCQVTFNEHPEVSKLMQHYTSVGKAEQVMDGWRIKIISTTDRRALENAKYKFEQMYPDYSLKQDYEAPYYSLKVGAYEDRFAVEPVLALFKEEFTSAIPFRDKISKQELFDGTK